MVDQSLTVVKINVDIDKSDLKRAVQNYVDNSLSSFDIDLSIKDTALKSGKNVCVVDIKCNDSGEEIKFVLKDEIKNYKLESMKLSNVNDSFYEVNVDVGYKDLSCANLNEIFIDLAKKGKGTYASIYCSDPFLIVNGRKKQVKNIGIIDENNILYSANEEPSEMSDADNDITYIPKYTIDEWLTENTAFKANLNGLDQNKKLELMAQFAIYQKNNNKITSTSFRDIMIQLGNLADLLGGFTDETVKSVYQLIV